jgi:hypothetical protein
LLTSFAIHAYGIDGWLATCDTEFVQTKREGRDLPINIATSGGQITGFTYRSTQYCGGTGGCSAHGGSGFLYNGTQVDLKPYLAAVNADSGSYSVVLRTGSLTKNVSFNYHGESNRIDVVVINGDGPDINSNNNVLVGATLSYHGSAMSPNAIHDQTQTQDGADVSLGKRGFGRVEAVTIGRRFRVTASYPGKGSRDVWVYSAKDFTNVFSVALYSDGTLNTPITSAEPMRQAVNGYAPGMGPTATASGSNDADGDGNPDGPPAAFFTADWWKNLFEWLFVPSEAGLESWGAIREQMAAWGPFGVIKAFSEAWMGNGETGSGNANYQPIWEFQYPPPFEGTWFVDLRAGAPDDTVGSLPGKLIGMVRPKAGLMIYIVYFFSLMRFLRPRLTV